MLFLDQPVELSDTEMDIYNYITRNIDRVIYMRIRDLAAEVHYSTTTILRFCHKFGCDGFAEFRTKLSLYRKNQELTTVDESDETTYIEFLKRTAQADFQQDIANVVDILKEMDLVIFIGVGSSKIIAQYGALYFSSLFLMSISIDDLPNHPLNYFSENIAKNTCLFVLSVAGENQDLVKVIEQQRMANAKIISVTNSAKSTIAKLSDGNISYYINREQFHDTNTNITSQLPALYTVELVGKEMRKQLNKNNEARD